MDYRSAPFYFYVATSKIISRYNAFLFKFTVFANSLPRVWRAKFGDFCIVISLELLTELAKNRLDGLAYPAYAYFSLRNP